MIKILLVDPPGSNKGLNTGLAYLASILKMEHTVRVLDLNNIEVGLCGAPNSEMAESELGDRITAAVREFEPDLVGVSVKTFTVGSTRQILACLKGGGSGVKTVVGGPHITLDGNQFVQVHGVDFGIQGEGEYAVAELCRALEAGKPPERVAGCFYWKDGRLSHNEAGGMIEDLDTLPFPSYDEFSSVRANGGRLREYPLLSSRGCPYKCSYCSMPTIMGRQWRSHSVDRVLDELLRAKRDYGSTSFTVIDDNFTLDLQRVEQIVDRLIAKNVGLPWSSQNGIRADRISLELARKMQRSGCEYVWVGVESADETVFRDIHKGETLEDIETGIGHLKRAGIRVGGFFVTGLPLSTREADLKSVDFAKRNGIDAWWFNFVPYPHTDAWDWVQAHGRMLRSPEGAAQYGTSGIDPVFDTEEYPRQSRVEAYNEIQIRMGYFDRLAKPSLRQVWKWRIACKAVLSSRFRAIPSLVAFIVRYNVRMLLNRVSKGVRQA
jgi:anaerobic magnesium-protoporphyrin IX monomethyl ester cyclase